MHGQRSKGELATSRLHADSGQETDSMYIARAYAKIDEISKKKKKNMHGQPIRPWRRSRFSHVRLRGGKVCAGGYL
jgi:hypothetical protein